MSNTTRRYPRSLQEAFLTPPKRDTTLQGPYTRKRKIDPHRVVGWICLLGLALVLGLGL